MNGEVEERRRKSTKSVALVVLDRQATYRESVWHVWQVAVAGVNIQTQLCVFVCVVVCFPVFHLPLTN